MVAQPMVGDGVQPGGEAGLRFPACLGGDHSLPDVLEKLVGQGVVAQLAQQVVVQLAAMAGIQLLERTRITRGVGEHQGFIAGIQAIHMRQRTDCR